MAYTGEVKVGGPPQVRELAGLVLTKVSVGPMDNNAYLLRCRETGEQVLIDAANDAQTLLTLVESGGGQLTRVITTHQHRDHWQALQEVVDRTGAATAAHADDAAGIPVPTDEELHDGDQVTVGVHELSVIHLVGHTPGSITLLYDESGGRPHIFTGDSLFPGGVGNTHGSKEDFETLINDVEEKLFGRLPDETWVYPGHGKDTTLGAERPHLGEWRKRGW
jgi:glyoxylase-like metal-dependent hydrolase (beta-lactamase superfamily II)